MCCDYDFVKYIWNLYAGQTNERALKNIHSISTHHRFIMHHFWLVHGRFICIHMQLKIPIRPRNTETASSRAALSGVLL